MLLLTLKSHHDCVCYWKTYRAWWVSAKRRWRFLLHTLDRRYQSGIVLAYLHPSCVCCPLFCSVRGMGIPQPWGVAFFPLLKGLYYLSALSLWGWSALRHPAHLPDSSGSDSPRRAPDSEVFSVGGTAGISSWVVFWGWVKHPELEWCQVVLVRQEKWLHGNDFHLIL